jgi:Putative Actinobacterial Holin-X, holin superfamily III
MPATDNRSVSELFTDALNQFAKLVRNEVQLARKELSSKAGEAMNGIALLVCAGIFLIPALVELLAALAAWMEELGTGRPLAHLIAGVAGLVGAAIFGGVGMSRLKANALVPERTLNQIQQDVAAAKEHV